MARPRAIQGEVEKVLLEALEKGLTVRLACQYAGISQDTWERALRDDADFADKASRARLRHLPAALEQIRKHGDQDFRAAKAWVEMVYRDDYGRRLEVTGAGGQPVAMLTAEVKPEFFAAARRLLDEAVSESAPEGTAEPLHP